MFRRHLAAALSTLLMVAACAPFARAQSGRRLPQSAEEKRFIKLTDEKSDAAQEAAPVERVAVARTSKGKEFDLRDLNARRSAPVVFADDGGKHPNKADKIAGVAMLGYLALCLVVMAKTGGFAP